VLAANYDFLKEEVIKKMKSEEDIYSIDIYNFISNMLDQIFVNFELYFSDEDKVDLDGLEKSDVSHIYKILHMAMKNEENKTNNIHKNPFIKKSSDKKSDDLIESLLVGGDQNDDHQDNVLNLGENEGEE
jgi:hypothetical protein